MVHIKKRESLIRACDHVEMSFLYSKKIKKSFLSFIFLLILRQGITNLFFLAFLKLITTRSFFSLSFFVFVYYCVQITTQVAQFPVTLNNTEIGCIQSSTSCFFFSFVFSFPSSYGPSIYIFSLSFFFYSIYHTLYRYHTVPITTLLLNIC